MVRCCDCYLLNQRYNRLYEKYKIIKNNIYEYNIEDNYEGLSYLFKFDYEKWCSMKTITNIKNTELEEIQEVYPININNISNKLLEKIKKDYYNYYNRKYPINTKNNEKVNKIYKNINRHF